jgi:hypothetical protein
MIEEEADSVLTDDDVRSLRALLYSVKGLSTVSTAHMDQNEPQ